MAKASSVPVIPRIAITLTPYPGSTTADWQTGESIITVIGGIGASILFTRFYWTLTP